MVLTKYLKYGGKICVLFWRWTDLEVLEEEGAYPQEGEGEEQQGDAGYEDQGVAGYQEQEGMGEEHSSDMGKEVHKKNLMKSGHKVDFNKFIFCFTLKFLILSYFYLF